MTEIRKYLFDLGVEKTAAHEAGHLLVAHAFGLVAEFKLWTSEEERNWARVNPVRGACAYGPKSRLTPFAGACIGWAGLVGELVAGTHGSEVDLTQFRRLVESPDWAKWVSNGDAEHILREPERVRAAEKAFSIVTAHREALELAIRKASVDMAESRHSWVRPSDIGLTPHRINTGESA